MNQAHEQVTDICPVLGFIEERIFSVHNCHLKGIFTNIIIQRGFFNSEKERQGLPMVEHIVDRLAQTGVWFDFFVVKLLTQPAMQVVH